MNPNSSNFGIRGVEDLGNGLQAWFQLELAATLGSPSNSAAGINHGNAPQYRNSAVGLRSSTWGQISVGTWDTPFTIAAGNTFNANGRVGNSNTNLLSNTLGALGAIGGGGSWSGQNENAACLADTGVSAGGCLGAGTTFDRRQKGLLQWWSPNWSGFEARVAYAVTQFGDGVTASNRAAGSIKPNIWDVSLAYNNGPLAVGYAYERQNDLLAYAAAVTTVGGGLTNGSGTGLWQITGGGVSGSTGTGHRIGGKYTFALGSGSSIGVGAMWESLKWTLNYGTAVAGDLTEIKKTGWRLQGNFTTGNHFIGLEFAKSNELKGSITSTPGALTAATGLRGFDGSGTDSKVWILSYNYAFSKRTSLTAYYTQVNNGNNSVNSGLNSGALSTAAGADPKYIGLNLRHTF